MPEADRSRWWRRPRGELVESPDGLPDRPAWRGWVSSVSMRVLACPGLGGRLPTGERPGSLDGARWSRGLGDRDRWGDDEGRRRSDGDLLLPELWLLDRLDDRRALGLARGDLDPSRWGDWLGEDARDCERRFRCPGGVVDRPRSISSGQVFCRGCLVPKVANGSLSVKRCVRVGLGSIAERED